MADHDWPWTQLPPRETAAGPSRLSERLTLGTSFRAAYPSVAWDKSNLGGSLVLDAGNSSSELTQMKVGPEFLDYVTPAVRWANSSGALTGFRLDLHLDQAEVVPLPKTTALENDARFVFKLSFWATYQAGGTTRHLKVAEIEGEPEGQVQLIEGRPSPSLVRLAWTGENRNGGYVRKVLLKSITGPGPGIGEAPGLYLRVKRPPPAEVAAALRRLESDFAEVIKDRDAVVEARVSEVAGAVLDRMDAIRSLLITCFDRGVALDNGPAKTFYESLRTSLARSARVHVHDLVANGRKETTENLLAKTSGLMQRLNDMKYDRTST